MSLLELHPESPDAHEIPSGDDYTKGSSPIVVATIAAVVALVIAITIFVLVVRKPPVAAGTITGVYTHITHTLGSQTDANGEATPAQSYDQVLVLTNVTLRNQSDKPIILRDMVTNVTLPDGPRSSYVAGPSDYDRVFLAYPELAKLKTQTISRETMLQPGQQIEGMFVSAFHANGEEWAAHTDLSVTLHFQYHPDLVLTPGAPPAAI
ncbi:MAG TPA: hypothetical protein VL346_10055 [Acidobacteriaceae bacterium]|nr:hypothetical protein [Acidobacteriaceae bacterium]